MIECRGLGKQYGPKWAIRDLNLEIPAGRVYGFLGPNGAGKTTTIQMMVGLLRPTVGTILIDGHDIVQDPVAAKRCLGYVPDEPYLYEKLTGREYLEFTCGLFDIPIGVRRKLIDELLETFSISGDQHQLIGSFSHGMRQKIALIAALVHSPSNLFLDEPTVGLDPGTARLLKDILAERARNGATVLFSTHILEIAENICDAVAIIHHGRAIATGTIPELRQLSTLGNQRLEDIFIELTTPAREVPIA
ncbi:MAG: ABC-type multidrug transport system, ATPase component [Chloroflexi bacterium]|nr:ABC-type multidrug transport system, ATPase component [Chloroflexota bacterium]